MLAEQPDETMTEFLEAAQRHVESTLAEYAETVRELALDEARTVIALALDAAAWGDEPRSTPDGPLPSSESLDDADVALDALMARPDLLVALVTSHAELDTDA
jgi:hypothetical protein